MLIRSELWTTSKNTNMKLWPMLGVILVVSSSMQEDSKQEILTCYLCRGPEKDPFCRDPKQFQCLPGQICYAIHLKSIGVTMGCSNTVRWNSYESEYCHRYKDQFEPFITTCYDCSYKDLCNSNTAMVKKIVHPLIAVGVLINIHLLS